VLLLRTYYKAVRVGGGGEWRGVEVCVCVLLLQDLLQSCARGGRRRVEDMCYERRRAEACVDESAHHAQNVERCFITERSVQTQLRYNPLRLGTRHTVSR
jgi:hypothetical protein